MPFIRKATNSNWGWWCLTVGGLMTSRLCIFREGKTHCYLKPPSQNIKQQIINCNIMTLGKNRIGGREIVKISRNNHFWIFKRKAAGRDMGAEAQSAFLFWFSGTVLAVKHEVSGVWWGALLCSSTPAESGVLSASVSLKETPHFPGSPLLILHVLTSCSWNPISCYC